MIIMKFGGTSMGSAEMITNVAQIIANANAKKQKPIIVVSAMSGTTNKLLQAGTLAISRDKEGYRKIVQNIRYQHIQTADALLSDEYLLKKAQRFIHDTLDHFQEFLEAISIIQEISAVSHDEIISIGEKLSALLLSLHLENTGLAAHYIDLSGIVVKEFREVGNCFFEHVEEQLRTRFSSLLNTGKIPVLTGFFGKIPQGIVSAVGRGYSDFTAALSGAAFEGEEIQIWTDVDGLLSADPRMIPYTCVLPEVSFDEAGELAQFGAKVLHPQTVWPAVKKNIPVRIKNTMNPDAIGTLITKTGAKGKYPCKSLAVKKGVTVITLTSSRMLLAIGFLKNVFTIFAENNVSVDFVSTSEISVSITVNMPESEIPKVIFEKLAHFSKVDIADSQAIICVVGTELQYQSGAVAKIFTALAQENISVRGIAQSVQEINVSILIDAADADRSLRVLHHALFEEGK